MPLLPQDPLSIVGLGLILATVVVLLRSDWPRAYVLGMSNIVLFALQFLDASLAPIGAVAVGLDELGLTTTGLFAGQWWTPVSYAFLHSGPLHIFGNMFILLTAGPALEDSVGPRWFLLIYALATLGSGAAGVGLSLVDEAIISPHTLMVGASGAIFGVLTAYAIRHPREKLPLLFIIVLWLPSMTVLLIYLAMNIGYIFLDTNIAWFGHFAGFLVGLALAYTPAMARATEAKAKGKGFDAEPLSYLATDRKSREALEHLDQVEAGQEQVAHAWLDVLADHHDCPVCQAEVQRKDLRLVCQEGHDLALVRGEGS